MILLNNLKVSLDTNFDNLKETTEKLLKIKTNSVSLYRKSVDARHKSDVHFCLSVLIDMDNETAFLKKNKNAQIFNKKKYVWQKCDIEPKASPIVVGFGPCGIFCAYALAKAGLKPIVIEQGSDVDTRKIQVNEFLSGGKLNIKSNVQFGEGGAGTFSDGKLNTGIKDIRCREVLETFANFGADSKILIDAKPHIGTDVLSKVVKNIRNEIISLGGKVLFNTKLENINFSNGKITSVIVGGDEIKCDNLVLATGHSARDIFSLLKRYNVKMQPKPFSVGVRIEHLQKDINKSLYGEFYNHPALNAADYKMAVHLHNGRGVYTFCMCPGGEVINATSCEQSLTVNGMSNSLRDGINANSALLVGVDPSDFCDDDILVGVEFQRKIEKKAYEILSGVVPVTTVGQFCFGQKFEIGKVKPTVKPKYAFADFCDIFPKFVTDSLKEGIIEFGKKIKGFDNRDAILIAPETRSSSPVRILRDQTLQSVSLKGLYPAGEGAGYAGGIMSAAVDGIKVAEAIIQDFQRKD